ncbi:PREDICTED: heme-binding-like protein At3g10130, chloroplastic isoform X2 [Camelina sativa]|uniref:Heme-binding-like protein At3g10130, chloroplastic isoform X2 n=1 Tax=Camelina sativa TaxID=90675 RepID=A0ABM0W299_CAMSA|nr:PREDICTED: heme-binding-like protein At3g10130, chloroplastic isoform X2 [Camelina sativa]
MMIITSSIASSFLSSSHKKFSIDLNSYRNHNQRCSIVCSSGVRTARVMAMNRATTRQRQSQEAVSATESRVSLVFALASQASSVSQRLLADLVVETAKYVFPKSFNSSNLEEALMSVPDLETMDFKVLSKTDKYEIREVEPYFVAETTMPGENGFDFYGPSKSFNVLAEYLFGKNTIKEKMDMTTPVVTRKVQSVGEKMDMTTPVITSKAKDQNQWRMSFVMPSKYGSNLPLPKDPSVKILEVPRKIVAVVAFSGYVTDEEIERREQELRRALQNDKKFRVKDGVSVEVAQYNPPFTLPFMRRNEVSLEVETKED